LVNLNPATRPPLPKKAVNTFVAPMDANPAAAGNHASQNVGANLLKCLPRLDANVL